MTAHLTDAHPGAQLDSAPCMSRERYHVPHLRPADPIPMPAADAPEPAPPRMQDADVLQARRFIELLDDELADLQSQAVMLRRQTPHGTDKHFAVVTARMNEVQGMRNALALRFPNA